MSGSDHGAGILQRTRNSISRRIKPSAIPAFEELPTDETPENFVLEHLARPRSMSHHLSSQNVPSRKWLTTRARWWRSLMRLGMRFHGWSFPRPPKPDFIRKIQTDTIPIELFFYVPRGYRLNHTMSTNHRRWPMVVNFHGGGFTLGDASDDRYFARIIRNHTQAVFISVNYRRAPEHPFPQPVDDCVETLMYLCAHSTELSLDPARTALTGFSAGGNLCFTVPFRLTYYTNPDRPRLYPGPGSALPSRDTTPAISRVTTQSSIQAGLNPEADKPDGLNPRAAESTEMLLARPVHKDRGHSPSSPRQPSPMSHVMNVDQDTDSDHENDAHHVHFPASQLNPPHHLHPESTISTTSPQPQRPKAITRKSTMNPDRPTNLRILTIVAWYPLLDWTSSRSAKVRSSRKPSATLKKTFTDLFDHSYLPPPDDARNHISPFASPGLAPAEMIQDGLPTKIQLWLCEYDMLLAEGEEFCKRLKSHGKDVYHELVDKAPHGWDKSPNPFRNQKKIDTLYERSARELQSVFDAAEENPGEFRGERIGLGGLR